MKEEFKTLSEKIQEKGYRNCNKEILLVEDVKEFILEESELLTLLESGQYTWDEFHEKRRKLAGEDLVK